MHTWIKFLRGNAEAYHLLHTTGCTVWRLGSRVEAWRYEISRPDIKASGRVSTKAQAMGCVEALLGVY